MTESKKLQTRLILSEIASATRTHGDLELLASESEKDHDVRILHEMLPVIKQLVDMVRDLDPEGWHYLDCVKNAAPFIQED